MAAQLEAPESLDALYLSRGDEVCAERPVFTGDVYSALPSKGLASDGLPPMFVILQHPCALRVDGVSLVPRILVAEVGQREPLPLTSWNGSYRIMPLPRLRPNAGDSGHFCAYFPKLLVIAPEDLVRYERIACLSDVGVNLLLQRWVNHNSRVVVETFRFLEVTAGPLAEAEIQEEWVTTRLLQGIKLRGAEEECHAFLRAVPEGSAITRQKALEDPQRRPEVRRAARTRLKEPPTLE